MLSQFSNNEDATNSFVADPATTTTQIKRISDVTAASRSEARTDLSSSSVTAQSTNEGGWGLSNSDSTLDARLMNRNNANNPVVSALVDADGDGVPAGFNPNHAVGTNSNNYPWGQCAWYAYQHRAELGLPSSGNFGNGGAWAASASALGYWVDNTPRHVGDAVVFAPGQADADGAYGHVAVLEKINADGSIENLRIQCQGIGCDFDPYVPAPPKPVSSSTFTTDSFHWLTFGDYCSVLNFALSAIVRAK